MNTYKPMTLKGYCCEWCDGPISSYRRKNRKRFRKIDRRQAKKEINEAVQSEPQS